MIEIYQHTVQFFLFFYFFELRYLSYIGDGGTSSLYEDVPPSPI